MFIQPILFFMFAGVMLFSGLMVISLRNPVHSVLFLILAFFNSAGLFVMLGAEFVAMLMVIVYVGAVAVLFLFVVMMMDVNFAQLRQGFQKTLPLGLTVAVILVTELYLTLKGAMVGGTEVAAAAAPTPAVDQLTNTEALGMLIYTHYVYPFQVAGIILLVAMIGAIVLTLRTRPGVKRQNVTKQVMRKAEDCIEVVKVHSNKGI